MRRRERRCAALGARYLHVVVPEKLSIYADLAPGLRVDAERSPALALGRAIGDCRAWLDLTGPLRACRRETAAYYRTDSHWTFAGCSAAHRAICAALGVAAIPDLASRPPYQFELVGDLGNKLDPPRSEMVRRPDLVRDARRSYANAVVLQHEAGGAAQVLHRGAHVIYRNESPSADPRRVVLFGDSCAHFAPFMLTGMLAETFRELHFIWSASLDWGYLERTRPDLVIGEIVERFLSRVPSDRFEVEARPAGPPGVKPV